MLLQSKAYAKINLYLDVTGIRDNGYHNIKSIMQTVSLHDVVSVESTDAGVSKIELTCSEPAVPTGEKNIAYKAAAAFFREAGITSYDCRIHIDKHIPMEAGLAGGSTDAAAVLRLLNKIHSSPFNTDELCRIGAILGADVPFCIVGGTCLCEGIGEVLTKMPALLDCHIVVARGGEGVSTPVAYGLVDEKWNCDFSHSGGDIGNLEMFLSHKDIDGIAHSMYNIFEDVILPSHGVASELKKIMLDCGAVDAMMSGSG
ncbi:MAG: 4-(cytidine 5'-diphospho)-2-C-methyl-D-erythritol kinase, partial [Clostridia bacterium]|nr:4-(cytidine 5'-diphospho)-2-C-methyl-D-erythritol kinase [Clostridia bacterium]